MRRIFGKNGMVLPLSLLAIIAILGLVATLGSLNQGVKNQIYRTNNHQLSFLIAYSAFSRVCAKIHTFSWINRPFLSEAYTETKVALQGGHYDLLVENTVGKDFQADIYIRTHLAGISRMYFWRIRFNEDLLDVSNSIIVELYTTSDAEDFPTVSGPRSIATKVEGMLARRSANQKKSDQLASELVKVNRLEGIVEKLHGRVPGPFEQNWPTPIGDEIMANKPPVVPPDLMPPPAEEKPSAPGPDPMTAPGFESMTGNQIDELSKIVLEASEKLVEAIELATTAVEEQGVAGLAYAHEQHVIANAAKKETYSALNQLISESKVGIAEAPSAEVQKAIEEMVAQTVVSGIQNIVTAIDRGYDHLEAGDRSHLNSLPTSDDVENLLNAWKAAEERTINDLNQLNQMADKIENYAMTPEVAQALADAFAQGDKNLKIIQQAVADAEARLAELQALEAQAAAESEEENAQ